MRCRAVRSCPPADSWPQGQGFCPAPSTQRWAGTDSGRGPSGRKGRWTARSRWPEAALDCSRRTRPELLGPVPGPGSTLPAAPAASASFLACGPQVSAGEALSAASCWEAPSSCTLTFLSQLAPFLLIFSRTLCLDVGSGACLRGTGPPPRRCQRQPRRAPASAGPTRTTLHLWTGPLVAEHVAFRPSRGFRKGLSRMLSLFRLCHSRQPRLTWHLSSPGEAENSRRCPGRAPWFTVLPSVTLPREIASEASRGAVGGGGCRHALPGRHRPSGDSLGTRRWAPLPRWQAGPTLGPHTCCQDGTWPRARERPSEPSCSLLQEKYTE